MSCLPESGGCERQRTDPFVIYLNSVEASNYTFAECLERIHRNKPQPEVLYVQQGTNRKLVIERKSLVWPKIILKGIKATISWLTSF